MKVITWVFLILFIISSTFEIIFSISADSAKERKIAKPFPLLFLSIAAICERPDQPLIYVAAICGLLGDVFLLIDKVPCFAGGIFAFMAGHICYECEIFTVLIPSVTGASPKMFDLLIFIGAALVLSALLLPITYKIVKQKLLAIAGSIYFSILFSLSAFAVYGIVNGGGLPFFLLFCGGIIFASSDLLIVRYRFSDKKRQILEFAIMSTYLVAQALIVITMICLANGYIPIL